MPPHPSPALRALLWLALGAWLGAAALFAGAVAPAAFGATVSLEVAGNFVGRVLPAVHWAGVLMGVVVAALGRALGRRSPVALALALGIALLSGVSELVVSPAIETLRPALHAPTGDVAALRARFGMLHGLSVGMLGASVVSAFALALLHGRAERAEGG